MKLTVIQRYAINGFIATIIHYSVLEFNLHILEMNSTGLASMFAAVFGITCSFLGCRYFVFYTANKAMALQFIQFSGLYGAVALLHGAVLLVWTDWNGLDYKGGFIAATALQFALTYTCNVFFVFRS